MSLEATIFTHSGITSNFIQIAEFMHSRYTDYLISGLKGDSKISEIVDGWKEAEKIFEDVGSANNIVSEISKLLGGDDTISDKQNSENQRENTDLFEKNGLLENDSMESSNLLDEILNVKNEKLSFASDDDDTNQSSGKSTSENMDLLNNYASKKSTNAENRLKSPRNSTNTLPMFSTLPALNQTPQNHQNTLNPQNPLNPQNQDKPLQNFDNFTKINSILNRPSLLYVNSDTYSQRLHDPHTKSKQHLLPDSLVYTGIPTGQTRGKYKSQVEEPINNDNKLQCDWEGCNFSTPRKTALKRHIQCIHMDVRNYACSFDNCGKRFKRTDHLRGHMKRCRFATVATKLPKSGNIESNNDKM